MSEEANSPDDAADWSLLPKDPVLFFGLETGYERRDLKRAYNRLLRIYKPEKYPEEFQRLRAAYEELERRLRYGEEETSWEESTRWSDVVESSSSDSPTVQPEQNSFDHELLAKRLESGDVTPQALYAELKARTDKTPPDYYTLAVLADTVHKNDQLWFLRWLLEGLKAWPHEPGLSRLVYGFLCGPIHSKDLPKILVACSKAAPHDGFYALTEGAWDRLLRDQPFEVFKKTLQACEKELDSGQATDSSISSRIAFYIHAIRYAQWNEDQAWWREALDYVESNFDQAPPHLENDLDLLGVVNEYIAVREEFTRSHPLCMRMDRLLAKAITEGVVESDHEILQCQREILANSQQLYEAFPVGEGDRQYPFFTLWGWVVNDAAARYSLEQEEDIDYNLWRGAISDLIQKLYSRKDLYGSLLGFALNLVPIFVGIGLVFAVVMSFVFVLLAVEAAAEKYTFFDDDTNAMHTLLYGLVGIAAYLTALYWLYKAVWKRRIVKFWGRVVHRYDMRRYRVLWRSLVVGFLESSALDYFLFRALWDEQANDFSVRVGQYIHQDVALAVYSLALRFRV